MEDKLLSPHFSESEFRVANCEARIKENAIFLCNQILEPIRTYYNKSIVVTSGFRNVDRNKYVGGKPTSWHLYSEGRAACDFVVSDLNLTIVFDYIRMLSKLPFDKVILEKDANENPDILHIQVDRLNPPRRKAYVGHTGAATVYLEVGVL
jgi:peptidase M15-like protein